MNTQSFASKIAFFDGFPNGAFTTVTVEDGLPILVYGILFNYVALDGFAGVHIATSAAPDVSINYGAGRTAFLDTTQQSIETVPFNAHKGLQFIIFPGGRPANMNITVFYSLPGR